MSAPLSGRICLVTGATRGIGRGIALQLGAAGATVYITGRTLEPRPGAGVGGSLKETAQAVEQRGGVCIPVQCDHSVDAEVERLFERIKSEQDGRLDVLVNNAYTAVTRISESSGTPFWEQGLDMWDAVNNVGLRNHYICSILASRMMVPRRSGLIVNVSSFGGLRYIFNVAYGVGKEALDRMAADMAVELRRHQVAAVSLWPGPVQTEHMTETFGPGKEGKGRRFEETRKLFEKGETVEYAGKAIVALASDPKVMEKSGKILLTADLGAEFGFRDEGDREVLSARSIKYLLDRAGYERTARLSPTWLKIPGWLFSLSGNKH